MKKIQRIITLAILVWSAAPWPAATGHAKPVDDQTDALVETKWYWKSYRSPGEPVVEIDSPSKYVLEFHPDGKLNITADCNRIIAGYSFKAPGITITPGPATLAICPPGSKGEQLVRWLGDADQLLIIGSTIAIILKDKSLLTFAGPALGDRCGQKALAINGIAGGLDPKTTEKLDQLLLTFVENSTPAPGASLLVITPKGRYFKSVGVADVLTCAPLRADSRYQIGSNTKMMTATIIYQLQESGKLGVADRLSKWLPGLAARLPNGADITIEMLLTHTSGLPDYFEVEAADGKMSSAVKNKAMLTREFTPLELVDRVATYGKPLFKPGEDGKWSYSNTGYALLGLIIEKATGKSYEENLLTRIFKPLGLKQAFLQRGGPVAGSLPQAYFQWPFTFTTGEWNASQGWAAGAVVMTSDEFAVFLKALFTGRLLKKKQTLEMMLSIPPAGKNALGKGMNYGHGILENNGVLGHGGQTLGFQSDGGYIPGKDVLIVMWANSASNMVNRTIVPVIAAVVTSDQP
jgi:D-alanyl-D-alanine carboxypeptidase